MIFGRYIFVIFIFKESFAKVIADGLCKRLLIWNTLFNSRIFAVPNDFVFCNFIKINILYIFVVF